MFLCTSYLDLFNPHLCVKKIMEKLQDVANSIHESISVKVDYPSNHENQRLPILATIHGIQSTLSSVKVHD